MEFIVNFLKGMVISISQIIPGVSGGTIAIVLGIYDKLLHAVNNILKDFKNNYKILLQVALGAVVGIFLFSNLIKGVIEVYPIPLGYLFMGIILGGAPLMLKKSLAEKIDFNSVIFFIIGLGIVLLMPGDITDKSQVITSIDVSKFLLLLIGGIIIAIALILPGISGSFMLLVLGLYNTVITAVTEMNIVVLIPIALGGIIGTLLTSNIIERLLLKYPQQSYMTIFGFILGSVVDVFPGIGTIGETAVGIIMGICGFIFIYYISMRE